ncbi:hypothetical protein ABT052_40410 [Streptomyces sp. NPDC002766]|uniref:hypothetical protein n=1 Tax=Streptomyces sp. NPDC002766 TaxID=3154429 RepID=UPI0033196799
MSINRERLAAAAALIISVLVLAASVEIGRNALEALLTAITTYGTAVLAAALVGTPVGIRPVLKATRTVITVSVVVALVLYGIGKSLVAVIV